MREHGLARTILRRCVPPAGACAAMLAWMCGCKAGESAEGRPAPLTPSLEQSEGPRPEKSKAAQPRVRADEQSGQAPADPVIARLNARPITLSQIQQPLIEGYGLNILLNTVQLELAKQQAAREGISVSSEDIQAERELTLAKMFQDADKADYELLVNQFLEQQRISRPEFDLVIQTNAYLRKLVEPKVAQKITEQSLQEAFRQLYGETVQVRHIQLANLQEVMEAKRRLAEGQPFEQVARELSRNARTAGLGGELPPFSRQAGGYPQAFKDAAFALKEGEVSDAVQAEGAYHLIKLERRIPPKAVKFEDVKQSIQAELLDRLVQVGIREQKNELAQEAMRALIIEHPVLKQQYESRLHQREEQIRDRNEIREQFERERRRILERAATQPAATAPATAPTSPSAPSAADVPPTPQAPEVARPPATSAAGTPPATHPQ
ncbi:peptidylprolyl isomerase [Fontivita pretiosa]|uniref:peptidylprolyl isomerase n=1 Tax=Fontivita pretiosa TaxID=2989684 RepID=UPI003D169E5F